MECLKKSREVGIMNASCGITMVDREGNEVSLFTGISSNPKKSGTQNGTQKKADRSSAPIRTHRNMQLFSQEIEKAQKIPAEAGLDR